MRKRRGLSQLDLAIALGCTRQTVSAWECAVSAPTIETRRAIAKVLNTSVARVFPAAA